MGEDVRGMPGITDRDTEIDTTEKKNIRSWLRGYATNRKVAGSCPDEVIGFFQLT
jgi:hypothetical protein